MPLIQGRSNRRTEAGRSTRPGPAGAATDLPPYEPLSCALSDDAKRALHSLANSRDTRRYEEHIKKSIGLLGKNVAALNDRLGDRQAELRALSQKRAERGGNKSDREKKMEHSLSTLSRKVADLTTQSEQAVRDLIDRQAALQDDKAAAADMVRHFDGLPSRPVRRARRSGHHAADRRDGEEEEEQAAAAAAAEDEREELPPPDRPVFDVLEAKRRAKAAEYASMTAHQRYALNNDYAAFKKLWHDSTFGDQGVPLPDPSRWFDGDGNPVVGPGRGAGGGGGGGANQQEDDSDEDLVIEGEVQSFTCPLSLEPLSEPFTSSKCNHTFQKAAIVEWFGTSRNMPKTCPQTGCSQSISLKDLYEDEIILRKIQRARKRREQEETAEGEEVESQDEDEDEDENEEPRSAAPRVKRERPSTGH
ncbi:hypothetical protein SODALDRAFT_335365 [Sodiomyces alkalinus F11]|uniref:peptidylprolyl isomerase n=1 Tax=Sodiomyces alkalinus (strain CBS 110278 / VKM F-3762 / F11) TaxID=1314773 RepID=A0A3N2PP31_SODAK|nr:hypothetical protein SODALDRAFT_335365 [Sodiomyces alkalinus F11]ROT36281.1 hypothetical protein SODALDRAFT_335365 [Sodiomyces alkalinus F11]